MKVYLVTNEVGYGVSLIGIFDTRTKAENGRCEYITEHDYWQWLSRTLAKYVKAITTSLEKHSSFLLPDVTKERLTWSDEQLAVWWLDKHFKIREIELNAVINETLYEE